MTTGNEQLDDLNTEDTGETGERINFRREWEKSRKEAEELKAQIAAKTKADSDAARELAFVKAGIDVDVKGPGQLLFRTYDGELTKEAISAAAAEYGIGKPAVPPEEQAEYQKVEGVAAGAEMGSPVDDAVSRIAAIPEIGPEGRWDGTAEKQKVLDELRQSRVQVTQGLKPKSGVRWVQYDTPVPVSEGTKHV